jgi:coenzyme F420-0:L-glutamate ligase/coenzyme F420-1:gamma-L-glutamate ligase
MGQTNHAIGVSGLNPILDYEGTLDSFNKILRVTAIAIADEMTSASELVMGKSLKCPFAIIRDYSFDVEEHTVDELIEDLFR